jgi:RNA polymerase sigma-70 factor (ECF subfamily)
MTKKPSDRPNENADATEDAQQAFTELFAKSEHALAGFVFSLVPNRTDADDVLQETLRCLWEKREKFDPSRPFLPWATHFAYMQILQMRRKYAIRGKYFSNDLVEKLADERPVDVTWESNHEKALKKCLGQLSSNDLQLIQLRYNSSQSITDMSTKLGQTKNSFYKRLQRIRQELVECITSRVTFEMGKE